MKQDNSKLNFNYPGLSIEEIVNNPDEYIVPECIAACKSLWDKNIFTVSCSNRDEKKDPNGIITKYIMFSNLSGKNDDIFHRLASSNPQNFHSDVRKSIKYYFIIIESTDTDEARDQDSETLLGLASNFEMQDCMEGFVSLEKYYKEHLTDKFYPPKDDTISLTEEELISRIKAHLKAFGKLDLLDLDRRIVYNSEFYKKAHEKYLAYLAKQEPTNPDPHDDR